MKKSLYLPILLAASLWFIMFSPWTAPLVNFWGMMSCSGLVLTLTAWWCSRQEAQEEHLPFCISQLLGIDTKGNKPKKPVAYGLEQIVLGCVIAAVLWGVFWVGNIVSQWMFDFAGEQINGIYGMKADMDSWVIALLLLFVIGPAEEIFWRGYLQRRFTSQYGAWAGFFITLAAYTLVHIWAGNFMLIVAAGACGFCWGILYRFFPHWLPALILSHALWDAAAFVIFPF